MQLRNESITRWVLNVWVKRLNKSAWMPAGYSIIKKTACLTANHGVSGTGAPGDAGSQETNLPWDQK